MTIPTQETARPPLYRDRAFWGLNITQFLGAFNDNLFKQLVMLLCLDRVLQGGRDLQGVGMILFAWPFIAFSGFAGFLSDRFSKRTIIIACKVAELGIVLLGMIGFGTGSLPVLLGVLCLMGVHSAFFGPSKYGILPELLQHSDLPRANGFMLMATFLAIIFGLSAAGAAKQVFSNSLWLASLPCVVVALLGLLSSLFIRPTRTGNPELRFTVSSIFLAPQTRSLLKNDRTLLGVLLMSSVFWFVGGTVYPPAINSFGREQLRLDDLLTGVMAASTGLGIAVGCVLAGILSKDRVRGWLVRTGAWGLAISLAVLCLPGLGFEKVRSEIRSANAERSLEKVIGTMGKSSPAKKPSIQQENIELNRREETARSSAKNDFMNETSRINPMERGSLLGPYGSMVALICVGVFSGFFSVPLQVFLQAAAPADQKGRIIGAFNLLNWIGIAGSGVVYSFGRYVLVEKLAFPHASLFGFAALLILPVALFYRPPEMEVASAASDI